MLRNQVEEVWDGSLRIRLGFKMIGYDFMFRVKHENGIRLNYLVIELSVKIGAIERLLVRALCQ